MLFDDVYFAEMRNLSTSNFNARFKIWIKHAIVSSQKLITSERRPSVVAFAGW